jgi:hypothetical protein
MSTKVICGRGLTQLEGRITGAGAIMDGWRNTMPTIVIRAFVYSIHKGIMIPQQFTITITEKLTCELKPIKKIHSTWA